MTPVLIVLAFVTILVRIADGRSSTRSPEEKTFATADYPVQETESRQRV